ncbi:MAG: transglycosylase domain-containing protein, partial [Pseudomonadota bacterium]
EKRTYKAKLKELIQALILEKRYSKEEILEMYVNQFFVTGFGSGLGIASLYFFDKTAESMDLVESAFIAGSVKGPYRYNPFTKKTDAEKENARRAAKDRKDYVLENMLKMNFISKEQYHEAVEREIPFKEGKITYRLNVILDHIRDQLESDYFRKILAEQGIDNISTSGIKIYTSINKEIQDEGLKSLRRHLPYFDVQLRGYGGESHQAKYRTLMGESLKRQSDDLPFLCRITEINQDQKAPFLMVAWHEGGGIIDYEGMKDMGEAWLKGQVGQWAQFDRHHLPAFLKNFRPGDLIPVRLITPKNPTDRKMLALSQIPEMDGGIIVLREGMIKAMIGGFFDRFFNRAVDAKRQLGSIFKPVVYTAALQLKWNTLDPLINRKDLFRFESTSYVPRPDHKPEAEMVSMLWAGVKSENLATVWLLYHLTDRLNESEFKKVVDGLGLHRKEEEPYETYVKRIRDQHGVIVNREALMEAAFDESQKQIDADLIFNGQEDAIDNVKSLHYDVDSKALKTAGADEGEIRLFSFKKLLLLNFEMMKELKEFRDRTKGNNRFEDLPHFYTQEKGAPKPKIIFSKTPHLLEATDLHPLTADWLAAQQRELRAENIWIDGLLPSAAIELIQSNMKKVYKGFLAYKRYDPEVLCKVRDFKTLINLLYTKALAKKMGITTQLDPVLSFPLGSNAISINEAARVYQTIMTGNVYPLAEESASDMTPIITKILDRDGEQLWEYQPRPRKILSEKISMQISEILRQVMENGTGRQAKGAVQLAIKFENGLINLPIATFGKTGTANQFTNSSFAGYIPGINRSSGRLAMDKGYVITSYIGYDDNRPMEGNRIRIYGSSGALPLWTDTANAVINSRDYQKEIQVGDLTFDKDQLALTWETGLKKVPVSASTGLPQWPFGDRSPDDSPKVFCDVDMKEQEIVMKRTFEPLSGVFNESAP